MVVKVQVANETAMEVHALERDVGFEQAKLARCEEPKTKCVGRDNIYERLNQPHMEYSTNRLYGPAKTVQLPVQSDVTVLVQKEHRRQCNGSKEKSEQPFVEKKLAENEKKRPPRMLPDEQEDSTVGKDEERIREETLPNEHQSITWAWCKRSNATSSQKGL
ncbi:hypothetical protein DdX_21170 [Ditylenchus destructor]|uniref:Uncharacterized protein n=1 Tax=Ditylenchus destructor TaxID=166010 RepID=A0AAD4MFE3_9BILA|nr:hypothetical protein DdX_21170 [Ditylenchus destructor]